MPSPSRISILRCLAPFGLLAASSAWAQTPGERAEDQAVGSSVNYVFATDLGSGVYDLDGRTLQIYKLTYEKELRESTPEQLGVRFDLPVTFGFFDFKPTDVLSSGLPTRVDSFSVVPGSGMVSRRSTSRPFTVFGPSVGSDHCKARLSALIVALAFTM